MQLNLGEKIRELRRRDERTQENLADALGVTSQAVSRWEAGGSYPDMELMPSIANYFGVTIDELFGYENERTKKIDNMVRTIHDMNCQNNGEDVNMDECIRFAREALIEFPGNERIMLSLASVLYNAGYVRYGEYHLTDEDGYDAYDVDRHKNYAEWQEAIKLYEKLLGTLEDGELRHQAIRELLQLYVNTGATEKADKIAQKAPELSESRPLLRINTCDGKSRAVAYGKAILETVDVCAHLMISGVMANNNHLSAVQAVEIIRNAISLYATVCPDNNFGRYHASLADINLYLSHHLWRNGDRDSAFEALDMAWTHAKIYDQIMSQEKYGYTAPLLDLIQVETNHCITNKTLGLPELWPCWCVPDCTEVKKEMQADPRWQAWVKKTQA